MSFRLAIRNLLGNPGYAIAAILSLAIAIALNTVMFSVVEALLLRPTPYREPDRIYTIQDFRRSIETQFLSAEEADAFRSQARSFEGVAAYRAGVAERFAVSVDEQENLRGFAVSANTFDVLGVTPELGRSFAAPDASVGDPVVISHGMWQRYLGGRRDALGAPIRIGGVQRVVVGVMPTGFWFPNEESSFWIPISPKVEPAYGLSLVARVRPGVGIPQARSEASVLMQRLNATRGDPRLYRPTDFYSFAEVRRASDAAVFFLLQGVVICIALVACANVSNIVLARALARRGESAIRAALGATRWQAAKPMLVEGLLVVTVAATIGYGAGQLALREVLKVVPVGLLDNMALGHASVRTLVFTIVLALLMVGLCNGVPLAQLSRLDLSSVIGGSGSSGRSTGSARWSRRVLLTAQIAGSLLLLVNAAALVRGMAGVLAWSPGVETKNLYATEVRLDGAESKFRRLAERIGSLPEVQSVAGSTRLGEAEVMAADGTGEAVECDCRAVTPTYLQTLGISLKRGRDFESSDLNGAGAVVVDEALAQRLWAGRDPVGQLIRIGARGTPVRVVGVAARAELTPPSPGTHSGPLPALYQARPMDGASATVLVRGRPSANLIPGLRRAILDVDPAQSVFRLQSFAESLNAYVAPMRWYVYLFGAFTALALCLAAIGLYGVVSYGVNQQSREIAVRMAVGARPRDVLMLILQNALRLISAGVVLGVLGGVATSRLLAGAIVGAGGATAPVYATAIAVFALAVLSASIFPALRGARANPASTLRAS